MSVIHFKLHQRLFRHLDLVNLETTFLLDIILFLPNHNYFFYKIFWDSFAKSLVVICSSYCVINIAFFYAKNFYLTSCFNGSSSFSLIYRDLHIFLQVHQYFQVANQEQTYLKFVVELPLFHLKIFFQSWSSQHLNSIFEQIATVDNIIVLDN